MTYPSSFFFFLTVNCMCFECVFAGVHWPLHTGGDLLNSSPLHPSQFFLASSLNRRLLGLLELNHNYLPSSDGGESVHCVIPISPGWHEKRFADSEGEHYVGFMDLTGEAEFETGLRLSLGCSRCSFPSPLYLFIPLSLPLYASPSHYSLFLCLSFSICLSLL